MKTTSVWRGASEMTKMQMVAKTTLTILGIYAAVTLYRFYPSRYISSAQEPSIFQEILFFSAFTIFVAFIVYSMIFNNDSLSRKMAGLGQQLHPQIQASWLVKSLHTGLVFAGLMLLPNSVPTMIKTLKIFFLIRPAINDILISKSVPNILRLSYAQWYENIYDFLKAILALYLLCGAPHFIRWQLKHSLRRESNIEQTENPNSSITNSERFKNE